MAAEQVALVTGGMRCLGESIAQALHDCGHRVVATHSPSRSDVPSSLHANAAQADEDIAYPMDVADEAFAKPAPAASAMSALWSTSWSTPSASPATPAFEKCSR